MRLPVGIVIGLTLTLAWSLVQAQTNWQTFMPSLVPGKSVSSVAAVLPDGLVIQDPAADVPAPLALWSGNWSGWACRDKVCDVRLAVDAVDANGAAFAFGSASAKQPPVSWRAKGKFVEGELQATLENGASIAFRMRSSGDAEFHYQKGSNWFAGILTKEK